MSPRRVALALLPALALYVAVALIAGPAGPQDDEAVYLSIAERITHGGYADASLSDANYIWYPPGLPLVLSPLVALDLPLDLIRLLGPLALFGAAVLFGLLLGRFVSARMALAGAYAFALYPPFLVLIRRTFSEPLSLLLLTAGMLMTARALESRSRRDLVGAGAAFGAMALTRAAFGWMLVVLALLFAAWWLFAGRDWRPARVATIFAIALAFTTPWLAYTYSLSDRPLYWGNSGGLSLYWMASPNPGELGDWHPTDDAPPGHERFLSSLEALGPVERDVALQEEAVRLIREEPSGYLGNLPPNLSRILFDYPYTGEGLDKSAAVYALPNALLLLLLALSAPTVVRRRREIPFAGVVLLVFGATAFGFHLLFSAEPRMLTPVVPAAIAVIAFAADRRLAASRPEEAPAEAPGAPAPA